MVELAKNKQAKKVVKEGKQNNFFSESGRLVYGPTKKFPMYGKSNGGNETSALAEFDSLEGGAVLYTCPDFAPHLGSVGVPLPGLGGRGSRASLAGATHFRAPALQGMAA